MAELQHIRNPHPAQGDATCVRCNINPEAYRYFFRGVLAGERGAQNTLGNFFYTALHAACLSANIAPSWSPDSELQLKAVLDKLNFNDNTTPAPAKIVKRTATPARRSVRA